LKSEGIKTILHLGDVFDKRKNINFQTLRDWKLGFFDKLLDEGITMHIIPGNHDVFYRNTNEINAFEVLKEYPNIHIHHEIKDIEIDGVTVCVCPWIPTGTEQDAINRLKASRAPLCFGHFELMGFEVAGGHIQTHGMSTDMLAGFVHVYTGHYHKKSTRGNITYLGAPYKMNWDDHKNPFQGFHIIELTHNQIVPYPNTDSIFEDFTYATEIGKTIDFEKYRDKYVKVYIEEKDDILAFDLFHKRLTDVNPLELSYVDLTIKQTIEESKLDLTQSTLEIIQSYINDLQIENPSDIMNLMSILYTEAMTS
jgi:DNA repair exonuclease SbcCD nuclease subunit